MSLVSFKFKSVVILSGAFVAIVITANWIVRKSCEIIVFDCPPSWPISVFYSRIPAFGDLLLGVGLFVLFLAALSHLQRVEFSLPCVILWGVVLILGSNLTQGWERAFAIPVAGDPLYWQLKGDGIEYYHDALNINDPVSWIASYEHIQPELRLHSRSHPPGPVLVMYTLLHLNRSPSFIGIALACVSIALSACFLYGILRTESTSPGYGVFLFLLIPAVQIYYAVSIDALICATLLGAFYYDAYVPGRVGVLGSVVCLFAASFLTFGVVFIVPILLFRRQYLSRSLIIIGCVTLIYSILNLLLGFNYLHSFQIASALENPDGFRLLAEPVSFVVTRIEDIAEIILFFGPFLGFLALRGLRVSHALQRTGLIAVFTLLAMIATGAFRTGETARACLFIYPYLLFLVVVYLDKAQTPRQDKAVLLALVFGQGLVMQLIGVYFW
jgi:hypothetical protein